MKKCVLIVLAIFSLLFCACAAQGLSPSAQTKIIDIKHDDLNAEATADDIIVPFYLPQKLADGTSVFSGMHKQGNNAVIYTGDKTLVIIDYYDAGSAQLVGAPALGKAAVTTEGDSLKLVMLINENLGCVMETDKLLKEELINVAGSFYIDEGPKH